MHHFTPGNIGSDHEQNQTTTNAAARASQNEVGTTWLDAYMRLEIHIGSDDMPKQNKKVAKCSLHKFL